MKRLVCRVVKRTPATSWTSCDLLAYEVYDGEAVVSKGISSSEEWVRHDAGGYHTKEKFDALYPEGWEVAFDFTQPCAIPEDIMQAAKQACDDVGTAAMAYPFVPSQACSAAMVAIGRERDRCLSIVKAIETRNEAEAHLIETILRRMRGDE